jgi:3,4-dihydroxy 2-butanone 4-phosphate synthase/GTP cyclohydrolase II
MPHKDLSPIEEIIADTKAGRMFILVDDEDRENEGDLVIPAEKADAKAINFMAKYGRGLICLAMTRERVSKLRLPLMSAQNQTRHQTAFTVSIEAREGITTGISAADRARTVAVAIDPTKNAEDIITPGHVFPLVAREGGVLVRAGHTEAAVDIARLAGGNPAGVICEIMNEDGSMARLPDLVPFAKEHQLKIATIADLISYRRRTESLIKRVQTSEIESIHGGTFTLHVYANTLTGEEHLALVKGSLKGDTFVRMHRIDPFSDVLGDLYQKRAGQLARAMQKIDEKGSGVIVLINSYQPDLLSSLLQNRKKPGNAGLRDYGIGAQILLDLGIKKMTLLSNTERSVIGLEGYGLEIKNTEGF